MRALVVTHGDLGESLLRSARFIYSVDAPIETISNQDHDLAGLQAAITAWIDASAEPAVLMVDVGGGSCGIAARGAARGRSRVRLLAGVNLPMVLTFLSSHSQLSVDDLVSKMLDRALHAVSPLDVPDGAS